MAFLMTDAWAVLGIAPGASTSAISAAYRKASLKVHPDRCPGDPDAARKFSRLTQARDQLLGQADAKACEDLVIPKRGLTVIRSNNSPTAVSTPECHDHEKDRASKSMATGTLFTSGFPIKPNSQHNPTSNGATANVRSQGNSGEKQQVPLKVGSKGAAADSRLVKKAAGATNPRSTKTAQSGYNHGRLNQPLISAREKNGGQEQVLGRAQGKGCGRGQGQGRGQVRGRDKQPEGKASTAVCNDGASRNRQQHQIREQLPTSAKRRKLKNEYEHDPMAIDAAKHEKKDEIRFCEWGGQNEIIEAEEKKNDKRDAKSAKEENEVDAAQAEDEEEETEEEEQEEEEEAEKEEVVDKEEEEEEDDAMVHVGEDEEGQEGVVEENKEEEEDQESKEVDEQEEAEEEEQDEEEEEEGEEEEEEEENDEEEGEEEDGGKKRIKDVSEAQQNEDGCANQNAHLNSLISLLGSTALPLTKKIRLVLNIDGPVPGIPLVVLAMLSKMCITLPMRVLRRSQTNRHSYQVRVTRMILQALHLVLDTLNGRVQEAERAAKEVAEDSDAVSKLEAAQQDAQAAIQESTREAEKAASIAEGCKEELASLKSDEVDCSSRIVKIDAQLKVVAQEKATAEGAMKTFAELETHGPPAKAADTKRMLKEVEAQMKVAKVSDTLFISSMRAVLPALQDKPELRSRFEEAALSGTEGCFKAHITEKTNQVAELEQEAGAIRQRQSQRREKIEALQARLEKANGTLKSARKDLRDQVESNKLADKAMQSHLQHVAALRTEAVERSELLVACGKIVAEFEDLTDQPSGATRNVNGDFTGPPAKNVESFV